MKLTDLFEKHHDAHAAFEKWEDLLHHIAEEELVACKVHDIELEEGKSRVVRFIADCNDNVRKEGLQRDLTDKVNERLKKHTFPGLDPFTAVVIHKDIYKK